MPPGAAPGAAGGNPSPAALIEEGLRHHRAGRLDDARACYERALAEHGRNAEALHLLGLAAHSQRDFARAATLIAEAVALGPPQALHHHSLAEALRALDRRAEARSHYEAALALDPRFVEPMTALGNLDREAGDLEAARARFGDALALRPDDARLHLRLAEASAASSMHEAAAGHYRRAIALGLDRAGVHNNLGLALSALGQREGAIQAFRRAASLDAADPAPLVNLGQELLSAGDLAGAEAAFDAALRLDPSLAAAHLNRGNLERRRNRLSEAVQSYRRAAVLAPGNARAQGNLGLALAELGRTDEALEALRLAADLAPDDPVIASNLCYASCYDARLLPQQVLDRHRRWDQRFGRPEIDGAHFDDRRDPERVLRIGYVSPDFRIHPVGAFVAGPIRHHDRARVSVHCYASVARPDALTDELRAAADQWRDAGALGDAALAEAIRADRIDILVDLSGHMAGSRLPAFARRPAPVQVSWAGYPFSTGMRAIDWALVDAQVAPPGAEQLFTERLLRLPRSWTCYTPPAALPDLPEVAAAGPVVFGSFNNPQKIDDATLALWGGILRAAAPARLLLKAPGFDDAALRDSVARRLIAAGARSGQLDFAGATDWEGQLRAMAGVDVALDPLPYTGATTTIETLLMGTPVVTCAGPTYFRRHALGFLRDAGLGELVTADAAAYRDRALAVAAAGRRTPTQRRGLRAAMLASPVMDVRGFTRDLEQAYRTIWRDWYGRAC